MKIKFLTVLLLLLSCGLFVTPSSGLAVEGLPAVIPKEIFFLNWTRMKPEIFQLKPYVFFSDELTRIKDSQLLKKTFSSNNDMFGLGFEWHPSEILDFGFEGHYQPPIFLGDPCADLFQGTPAVCDKNRLHGFALRLQLGFRF